MRWAYGVTTVPERRKTLLPQTLASLKAAGFPEPILFVDGEKDPLSWEREFGLPVVTRNPSIRTFGNWVLSLAELYIRNAGGSCPAAERYAIFQDDFVTYRNLRAYLEQCAYPDTGYWNLWNHPQNQDYCPGGSAYTGWYLSNQRGRGAVGLIFSPTAVELLLTHPHMVSRPHDCHKGWRNVDGGIVSAFVKMGWKEYVHNPSLIQHTGYVSSMRSRPHPLARSFRGESFDALDLPKESTWYLRGKE